MALVTSSRISRLAVSLLTRRLALPMTVSRVPSDEYSGPSGGSVIIRVPVPRDAKIQENPGDTLDFSEISEIPVETGLEHIYDGARITLQQRTLDIENFTTQVVMPQVRAVAVGAEDVLADVMNALPIEYEVTGGATSNIDAAILSGRADLGRNHVPMEGRWLAASPALAEILLGKPNLTPFDSPPTPTALTEARIGRYRGFNVVETAALTGTRGVLYHESSFAFANSAPADPEGATQSSTAVEEGISLRHIYMFDPTTATDRSLLSTFAGAALVDADRAVVIGNDDVS